MTEVATSLFNKNSLLYGDTFHIKNEGPACVEGKGESTGIVNLKPVEAPIKAVREK